MWMNATVNDKKQSHIRARGVTKLWCKFSAGLQDLINYLLPDYKLQQVATGVKVLNIVHNVHASHGSANLSTI